MLIKESKDTFEITFENEGTADMLSALMTLMASLAESGSKINSVMGELKNGKIHTQIAFRDEALYQKVKNPYYYSVPMTKYITCDLDLVAFAVIDSLTLTYDSRSFFDYGDGICEDTLNYMDSDEYDNYKYYAKQVFKIFGSFNYKH